MINNGVFWDDWALFNHSYAELYANFIQNGGHPITTNLHHYLMSITSYIANYYHILTFLIFLFSSIVIYKTLILLEIEENELFFLILTITFIPYNFARIFMIVMPYSFGFLFMNLGIYFFVSCLVKNNTIYRILSLFFISLTFVFLNSTLVFVPFVLFLILVSRNYNNKFIYKKNIFLTIKKIILYSDFFVLPIIYWVIKKQFLSHSGNYSNYNQLSVLKLLISPIKMFVSFFYSVILLIPDSIAVLLNVEYLFLFVLLGPLIFLMIKKVYIHDSNKTNIVIKKFDVKITDKTTLSVPVYLTIGIILFIAGVFPYTAVGHYITFNNVISRDQILLSIGSSFIFLDFFKFITIKIFYRFNTVKIFIIIMSLVITLFVCKNVSNNLDALRSFHINESIMLDFKKSNKMRNSRNFLYEDNISVKFWKDSLRFYSLSGMTRNVFGNQKRFILIEKNKLNFKISDIKKIKSSVYNLKDIQFKGKFDYLISVNYDPDKLSFINLIKITYIYYFDKKNYMKNIDPITILSLKKI